MEKSSPGQTDSQVFARLKLGSTCDSVWPGLACTCVDLRSLWSRSNLHASQCKVFTVSPPNASLFENSTCRYLRLLAIPFDQGFNLYFSMITNCVGKKCAFVMDIMSKINDYSGLKVVLNGYTWVSVSLIEYKPSKKKSRSDLRRWSV